MNCRTNVFAEFWKQSLLMLAAGLAASAAVAEDLTGAAEVAIIDAGTHASTTARVEILDAQGKAYVSDNALPISVDGGQPANSLVNPYTGKTQFYADGLVRATLPAGSYQFTVIKGIEYRKRVQTVEVKAGQETKLTMQLERWADMPSANWYSADGELHIARPSKAANPGIARWMQAEDIHVANLLQWVQSKSIVGSPQYAFGPDGVYQEGSFLLASGQENPVTNSLGHTITFGGSSWINFPDEHVIYRRFWEEAGRQGALVGYTHFGRHLGGAFGLSVDLPHEPISFIEVLQFGIGAYDIWYDTLNTGFRVTPLAGTDYPFPSIPGRERFYARVDGKFDFNHWLAAVRAGRTFVTNGPLLDFHVADATIGDELKLPSPRNVVIEGLVRFDPERDAVERVEVICNGRLIRSVPRRGNDAEIRFSFEYPIERDCWLAVRVNGYKVDEPKLSQLAVRRYVAQTWNEAWGRGSLAHSAPIYVTVHGGVPLASQPEAKMQARAWIARLDDLRERLSGDQVKYLVAPPNSGDIVELEVLQRNRPALLQEIESARRHFEQQAK